LAARQPVITVPGRQFREFHTGVVENRQIFLG
jgi:hypothetical protein